MLSHIHNTLNTYFVDPTRIIRNQLCVQHNDDNRVDSAWHDNLLGKSEFWFEFTNLFKKYLLNQ